MNRPLSMTSFGRGESGNQEKKWIVELRSVNHRFCDVKIKIPREYAALEEKIKKDVATSINRGHVDVMVTVKGQMEGDTNLVANIPLAQEYYNSLLAIQQELNLPDKPTLALMVANRDLISTVDETEDMDKAWNELQKALTEALNNSNKMRITEGQALKIDLLERLDLFENTVKEIEDVVPDLIKLKEKTLKEKLAKLLGNVDMDPVRLAQEVAIIADKSDITEELVRLKSHINQFRQFMELDEPVGRRLDFLLQEFLREINTTASKINYPSATHKTVVLKNEMEKMREQVQNLE